MVICIFAKILHISSMSVSILFASDSDIYSVSNRRRNQYFVSLASLYAMDILFTKSAVEAPPTASSVFAPIEVPLRSSCLLMINSLFVSLVVRYLYSLIIRTANAKVFSTIILLSSDFIGNDKD